MFFYTMLGLIFGTLLITTVPDAAAYSKYGRSCKDIGCRSDETCVMAEDPCTAYSDKCGRYPTCQRVSDLSCTSLTCGSNEYCKFVDGAPKCVRKSAGFESAGVSYVNGERVVGENNANPYANANAPPPAAGGSGGYQSSSGGSLYPPYPGNTGSSNGYPPYPQSTNQANRQQQDLGYPPYPTQNRMPTPGHSSYPSYPQYPQTHGSYPQQYPGYQSNNNPYPNYPQQNNPNQNQRGYTTYRRNAASVGMVTSVILVGFSELFVFMMTRL